MAIVVDFSHLLHRHMFASQKSVIENPDIVAHLMLNSLFNITNTFDVSTGNVLIVAFDCKRVDNWRTKYYAENSKNFPEYKGFTYKGNRKKDLTIPWAEIYNVVDDVKSLLREGSDVQVVDHENAEADDVIYAATRHYKNELLTIISSDRDFHQLVGKNVIQFDPIKKKRVGDDNSEEKLLIDILTGQKRKDNILPCAPRLGEKTAQTKVKSLEGFLEIDTPLREHFAFNKKLIDLSQVPEYIIEDLDASFEVPHYNYNFKKMLEFCRKYNLRKISEKIDQLHFKKTTNIFEALA